MKKGPLNKKDKKFIEENKNKTVNELAILLDRKESVISNYIEKLNTPSIGSIVVDPVPVADTHIMSMMAKNKKFGVVVMTENASMASDEVVKKRIEKQQVKNVKPNRCIHKIRDE